MSTEEQNKLIGFFMEMKLVETFQGMEYYEFKGPAAFTIDAFKYHSSWDWFHPAWYKFRNIQWNSGLINYEMNHRKFMHFRHQLVVCVCEYETPERAAELLAEAITWYNTQNK